jgi:hypothetical protein
LADELTAGVESPYQKARAIYHYFQNGFAYTLQAPELPEGADAVDTFLFTTRQGSCEMFASAMAVLLRAAGIPARLVTGYATGTYNILTGYYEVRNSDAHAWVEIFHPGIGWLEIEATPSFESVVDFSQQPTGQWLARDAAEWVFAAIARSAHALLGSVVGGGSVAAVALVAAGLAARWATRFRRRSSTRGPRDRIERDYQAMLRGLARRGFVRHPAATPREFAGALPIALRSSAGQVTRLFEALRYGHEPSNPRTEGISHTALHQLWEELRRSRGGARRPRPLRRAS